MAQNAAAGSAILTACKSGTGLAGNRPAVNAENRVVAKNVHASSGKIGTVAHRFNTDTPMAQNMPDIKL